MLISSSSSIFYVVYLCKTSTISISTVEYLNSNPKELEKLVKYVKGEASGATSQTSYFEETLPPTQTPIFVFEDPPK